ncbi:MAG: FtsX-like permease family protein [Acidobacteriota bacterium]
MLARRYLRSTRRDAFVRFLSRVASWGIAVGVAALVLSLAALSGLQRVLRTEVLARTPQIEIELPASAEPVAVEQAVSDHPEVVDAQITAEGRGWLVSESGLVEAVQVVGFAGSVPASFPQAAGGPEGLYVDTFLANGWGLEVGDIARVVSPKPTLMPFGPPQPRVRSLPLAGTFPKPRTQEDRSRIAVPVAVAEALFGVRARRLQVDAGGLEEAIDLASRLTPLLPEGNRLRTWREINRPLFFVLRLEKAMMFVAVSLVVLVASLSLVSSLSLVIANKKGEIGMLGAMGASGPSLSRAFLLLGGLLAGRGLLAGTLCGVVGAWLLDRFRMIRMPGDVFVFDYIPFLVRSADVAAVVGLTLFLALTFSLIAARRAAAVQPVAALTQ